MDELTAQCGLRARSRSTAAQFCVLPTLLARCVIKDAVMTTLFIDMPSGVAGDMLLAALIDLGGDVPQLQRELLTLGLGPIGITVTTVYPNGLRALHVDVAAEQTAAWDQRMLAAHMARHGDHHHDATPFISLSGKSQVAGRIADQHAHRPYRVIRELLTEAPLSPRVRERAQKVFRYLAEAEAQVHGVAVDDIEFHEVGSLDAIADIVGCCLLLEQLGIDHIISSALIPGNGTVRCAHGLMPVPVPAVVTMLANTGAPQRLIAENTGEITTPTGCALITALTDKYLTEQQPILLTCQRTGCGAGTKIIPGRVNIIRASLVTLAAPTSVDTICELHCHMDDCTGEQLSATITALFTAGAVDAYTTPIYMKKGRPGHALTVLCKPDEREKITTILLQHSTSIGVRHQIIERTILPRTQTQVDISGHRIGIKIVTLPDGSQRAKPESDDVQHVAQKLGKTFTDVQIMALDAWRQTQK
jgi:pyridinium-3,5-bisthiocarboxylic acid mononucleotide nickel chelatase